LIQLLLSKTANKISDKYSLNSELSNYLLYMLLHPTRILDVVPIYAKVIKNRLFSRADPSKHYPQNIHSIYKKIKYSNFSYEVHFTKSYFNSSSEKPVIDYQGQRSVELVYGIFNYDKVPDWNYAFKDLEQIMSMHR